VTRFFPLLLLLIVAACAWAGWQSVPHYSPPPAADEARLRERAAEFYRASRVFDTLTMGRTYTPARQLAETEKLQQDAEEKRRMFEQLDAESRSNLEISATSVDPAALSVEIDGDWAETSGTCTYPAGETEVEVKLERLVWVRSGGDWWVYTWTNPEIAAYGNPSLEAMKLLRERRASEARQKAQEYKRQLELKKQPVEPGATEPEPDGGANEDSPPETNGEGQPPG
jgi:hypothetical protein